MSQKTCAIRYTVSVSYQPHMRDSALNRQVYVALNGLDRCCGFAEALYMMSDSVMKNSKGHLFGIDLFPSDSPATNKYYRGRVRLQLGADGYFTDTCPGCGARYELVEVVRMYSIYDVRNAGGGKSEKKEGLTREQFLSEVRERAAKDLPGWASHRLLAHLETWVDGVG